MSRLIEWIQLDKILDWVQSTLTWLDSAINWVTVCAGSILCYLFGGFDIMIELLLTAMALDFITGFMKGVKLKNLSSRKARDGMFKKVGTIIVLASAVILDKLLASQGKETNFRNLIAGIFIVVELISLTENVEVLGVKLPKKLRDVLIQLRNKEFQEDEEKK